MTNEDAQLIPCCRNCRYYQKSNHDWGRCDHHVKDKSLTAFPADMLIPARKAKLWHCELWEAKILDY